jgi:Tfp pilus assembly protein PilZ
MSDEKRQYTRLDFASVLQIQIANKSSWAEATCTNMSAGGVLVTAPLPIAIDTAVTVQLKNAPEKFTAQGKVIRLVESEDEGRAEYLIAIKYNDTSVTATH